LNKWIRRIYIKSFSEFWLIWHFLLKYKVKSSWKIKEQKKNLKLKDFIVSEELNFFFLKRYFMPDT
jgi:hypothetical protein